MSAAPADATAGVEIDDVKAGSVSVRTYRRIHGRRRADADATRTAGALVWLHGGGLMLGDPRMDDARCAALARDTGMVVVAPRYRLAPDHRAPAALDDAHAAWTWLRGAADELGVERSRIAVGGASAGAGLAACLAQRLRDEAGAVPAAQVLLYPMLDDATAARRELDGAGHLVWSNRANRAGWRAYLGREPGSGDVPDYAVAARCDDLSGLPPAWIGIGDLDLFLDEGRAYADRLEGAGTPVTWVEVSGAPHGFDALMPAAEPSVAFASSYTEFLRTSLASR